MYGERFSNILTQREIQVLNCMMHGSSNKETARLLGISPRTVEVHRMRVMSKMNAANALDLCRIVLERTVPPENANLVRLELQAALDAAHVQVQAIETKIRGFYDALGTSPR